MTKRNERTSKRVASKAGKFLAVADDFERDIDAMIERHQRSIEDLKRLKRWTDDARSIAGSCLTQVDDKAT